MKSRLGPHIHYRSHSINSPQPNVKEIADFHSHYDIILLTLHPSNVDDSKVFEKECEKASNAQRLVIPCYEDENHYFHLLLIGTATPPKDVFSKDRNYLVVLAHLYYSDHMKKIKSKIDYLQNIDGVEVWNQGKESKKYPFLKTLRFVNKYFKNKKCYIGLDNHPPYVIQKDFVMIVDCEDLTKKSVLEALKEGSFYCQAKGFTITSTGELKKNNKKINIYFKTKCLMHQYALDLLIPLGKKILSMPYIKKSLLQKFIKGVRKKI